MGEVGVLKFVQSKKFPFLNGRIRYVDRKKANGDKTVTDEGGAALTSLKIRKTPASSDRIQVAPCRSGQYFYRQLVVRSLVQCSAVSCRCSAMQCSAVSCRCSAMQCSAVN